MLARFDGTVESFADVNVAEAVAWIKAIDLRAWPQQSQTELKPAMVTDPAWFGFGKISEPIVSHLITWFPGCTPFQRMLSVVMPGHDIEPHIDQQAPYWLCRVHVPLTSNEQSRFIVGGLHHHLEIGRAYRVNTLAMHSVENNGATPRTHFMFDVRDNA